MSGLFGQMRRFQILDVILFFSFQNLQQIERRGESFARARFVQIAGALQRLAAQLADFCRQQFGMRLFAAAMSSSFRRKCA